MVKGSHRKRGFRKKIRKKPSSRATSSTDPAPAAEADDDAMLPTGDAGALPPTLLGIWMLMMPFWEKYSEVCIPGLEHTDR